MPKGKFRKYTGHMGLIWLVCGNEVYVHDKHYEHGFGGDTMTFELVGGGTYVCKGPWASNFVSMLDNLDIQDDYEQEKNRNAS